MAKVQLEDLQRNPLEYLRRVKAGERLIIVEAGQAVAELKPVATPLTRPRPIGLAEGSFQVSEDFDASLPNEVLALFEEKGDNG